jgi:predicted ATPase/class 3 adenylate cyclase
MNLSLADIAFLDTFLPPRLAQLLQQPDVADDTVVEVCKRLEAAIPMLVPFVPSLVLDAQFGHVRSGSRRSDRIDGSYYTGAIVLIDVSGLAGLSSKLATTGRRGDEELSTILNRLLAMLVEQIYAHGGGLIKFGGETLTAFFDANRLGPDHTALACAAALATQVRMAQFAAFPTSVGSFQLRLRIAVHRGKVFAAEVGDDDRAELIVTGRAINRVVSALEGTAPGEVIISDEARQALGVARTQHKFATLHVLHALGSEVRLPPMASPIWHTDRPNLEVVQMLIQSMRRLQRYVPHGLPYRLVQANAEGGEFRPVTVLFANFYAISKLLALLELPALVEHDMTVVGRVLHIYYTHMRAIIRRYGGSINKVDMATFGDRLLALFGAPLAHEDDPLRAVQAALDLRSSLGRVNQAIVALLHEWTDAHPEQRALLRVTAVPLRQRIGITTGAVYAGIVGTPQRHDYTVIGEPVVLADQLLTVAGNDDVLLSATTHRAVHHLFQAELLAAHSLKRIERPVKIFRVLQKRRGSAPTDDALLRSTPLVGRQAELAQLLDLASRALSDSPVLGHVGAIVGEVGVGKSRLVDETLRELRATMPDLAVIRAACQSYEQTIPYITVARLLRQVLGLSNLDHDGQLAELQPRLDALVPSLSRFAPLLGSLLNLALPDSDLTQSLTPEQRRDRLHDLVAEIFFAQARSRPHVLVVDDLQWADASSRLLLQSVAEGLATHSLLLLLIYRPSPDLAESWRNLGHAATIVLDELDPLESEALLTALLDGPLPAALHPLIEHSHGTPLFLEETVRYLLETGGLQRDSAGQWVCTHPIDESTVPTQLEQLIVARLDRLDEGDRRLLEIGAVIGQCFAEQLIASVSWPARPLAQHLGALVDADLLLPDETTSEPAYRFKQALIRDVTYSRMLFARRRELHDQVATAIEQVYAADLDHHRPVLAQHFLRAGDTDRAFLHLVQAAQGAQSRYANSEALDLYQQALAIAPWLDQPQQQPDFHAMAGLHENLGDTLARTGDYIRARDQFEVLLRLLGGRATAEGAVYRAALQRKIGTTYEHQGNLDLALIWFVRAADSIRMAPPAEAAVEHARLLSDTGWLHFRRGELDQAQRHLDQALERIASLDVYHEQASIHNRLGGIAWTRGDVASAQHYVEQWLAASERSGDLEGQANALNNLGLITETQGRIEDSIRYGLQAIEINERIGSRRGLSISALTTGYALYEGERYQQAHEYFMQAFKLASEVRDAYLQMMALLNLGRVLAAKRQWESAARAIQQSQFIAVQLDLQAVQLDGQIVLGEIALHQGDIDGSIEELGLALPLAADDASEEYGRFQRLEAQIAFAQGDQERAVELLEASQALFTRLHNLPELERTRSLLDAMVVQRNSTEPALHLRATES